MTKYVKKLNETQLETLTTDKALNYLDETELNADGYKEFIPATREEGKPYRYTFEETATQIIEHIEEIIPDPIDILNSAKKDKNNENDEKAEFARQNQFFTLTIQNKECSFQTTRKTQQDLSTAKDFIQVTGKSYQWFSDNNEEVYLTLEDVVLISTTFMEKANVYPIWSNYKTQIDNAKTIEELEQIEINYNDEE